MEYLVTGNAGFIGFHVVKRLLESGHSVVGIDTINDYYEPSLKRARLKILEETSAQTGTEYVFVHGNIADLATTNDIFETHRPRIVVNLAAQAGVRYSLENPHAYVESNVVGFTNLLEGARYNEVEHFVYASTSSVYGANTKMPFSEHEGADHPIQFYAATKRANELMAHAYSHLFKLPTTGLRFFTVYGPWGRPDMAPHRFTKSIIAGEPIQVFNNGNHSRDFTHVDDVAEAILRVCEKPAVSNPKWDANQPDPATSNAPFQIFNIGNSSPVNLMDFIHQIEAAVGREAVLEMLPLQKGDVPDSFADTSGLETYTGYRPMTSIEQGVKNFVDWHLEYY